MRRVAESPKDQQTGMAIWTGQSKSPLHAMPIVERNGNRDEHKNHCADD